MDGGPAEARPPSSKRKMKTAYQLEILESAYASDAYPSESIREELSVKLDLTDRQLQMWFCHRRLKDRNNATSSSKRARNDATGEAGEVGKKDVGSELGEGRKRKAMSQLLLRPPAVGRMEMDVPFMRRHYEPPPGPRTLSILERRAISFVESQLGEPLREDGPVLGIEFDPLPPDAFGAPLEPVLSYPKGIGRYDAKPQESQEPKFNKAFTFLPTKEYFSSSSSAKRKPALGESHSQNSRRVLQEYQFLPEQPSTRADSFEKVGASRSYESLVEPKASRAASMPSGGSNYHGTHQVSGGYGYQTPVSGVGVLPQHERQGQTSSFGAADSEGLPHKNFFTSTGSDAPFVSHQLLGLEAPLLASDKQMLREGDSSRMERKRKKDEAQIQKEVEAHEKKIRKEIERQDILRRKKEEQMQREMEKHDRERQKEEERLSRERQREELRFQREQRRELERQEKLLQKENLRAEKLKLKEEQRRQKEAAKLKAAYERASARRIARESMELIEDERLELMELTASSMKLPSILSLDCETLQNLESLEDSLPSFPPQAVQLKKPFRGKPWSDSEEKVGNLLMVWRFLITFTDVLELWPFTLDEFVQALHDYDPRLLGEIHISLLKSIIKDIEDVARTPQVGLAANQNGAANSGGGHPQIVEGAYAWGFNMRSWQCHLSPATWPEVLRQLALSAGFGPQLKKRPPEGVYLRGENEGHDGENIISTLRNGTAAENAVALMREKGYTHNRRSRHRLTPGTVKFAAFYVLSFEGEKGLTILEVADKIQKSGLRDLTTSKTPEASIGAALSRDTLLFERTAPSTYCVRAPYRKDPADAQAILAAAREKLKVFENGHSDSEEAEKDPEFPEDVDGEEDFDGEYAEDPEVDNAVQGKNLSKKITKHVGASPDGEKRKDFAKCPSSPVQGFNGASILHDVNGQGLDDAENFQNTHNMDFEGAEIDESSAGEPWVQGLTEGEYSDLTVEERLNALVALVGVAIEGNSIRVVLEERLEAANCLKKQMWVEAQSDKRRMKDDFISKAPYSTVSKSEANIGCGTTEGHQSPLRLDNDGANDISVNPSMTKQEVTTDPLNAFAYHACIGGPDIALDNIHVQHYGYVAAEKSRTELKSYINHKAEEMYVYRSLPLGQDRRRNRYWQFVTSPKNDPGSGWIFFESQNGCWRLIDTIEAFDALVLSLDTRGIREAHLHSMLKRVEETYKDTIRKKTNKSMSVKLAATESSTFDCTGESDSPLSSISGGNTDVLDKSHSFEIEFGGNETERKAALKRYHDMQKWLWKECSNTSALYAMKHGKKRCSELLGLCTCCNATYFCDEHHCPCCHQTFGGSNINQNFSEHVIYCEEKRKKMGLVMPLSENFSRPARIELLKAQLALIEASIPAEALQSHWTDDCRKVWGSKLHASISVETVFQLFTQLEFSINPDYLSENYETTKEHLGTPIRCFGADDNDTAPVLPWIPTTTAAAGFRLMEFDASMCYIPQQKLEPEKDREADKFNKICSSRYVVGKNMLDLDMAETRGPPKYLHPKGWEDHDIRYSCGLSRGRGGRGRGRGRSCGSRSRRPELGRVLAGNIQKQTQGQRHRGSSRGRACPRGRRTVRKRQSRFGRKAVEKVVVPGCLEKAGDTSEIDGQESPQSYAGGEEGEAGRMYAEGDDNNSHGLYDCNENVQLFGNDEYEDDYQGTEDYSVSYKRKREDLMHESEDDGNGDEDDDGEGYERSYYAGDEDADGDRGRNQERFDDMDEGIEVNEFDDEGNSDEDDDTMSSPESSDN